MTGYGFYSSLRFLIFIGGFALIGLFFSAGFVYNELATEAKFRSRYGAEWRDNYEAAYGPLSKARTKMVVSAAGFVTICGILVWLARLLQPKHGSSHSHHRSRHRHHSRSGSSAERWAVNRRNALIGIYFGVFGIIVAALLEIFRFGIFREHADEMVLGIFIFIIGYLGVIGGGSYWLKAKGWNEGIVAIAFLPLGILLIPFVRLVFVAVPPLLPTMMFMMPLILIVVIAVLPDKSGRPKTSWKTNRSGWGKLAQANSQAADAGPPSGTDRQHDV